MMTPEETTVTKETRRRVHVALAMLLMLAMFFGLSAQRQWDAQCEAQEPGTYWNGDDWLCETR